VKRKRIIQAIVRGVLTTALLFMVYREAGIWTALTLLLMSFAIEALAWKVFG
jgi:hypothetical protein